MKKAIIQTTVGSVLLCTGIVILSLGLSEVLPYESAASTGLLMLILVFVGGIQLYLGIRNLRRVGGDSKT